MATNGNSGGTINYSSPGKSNMGITGGIQNRRKGQEFHDNFFRETSGYLDNTTAEMQNLIKGYKEISALTDKMTKAEQTRFKKMQESFKEQVKTLEYVKDTREIDYEEANKLIKESNKLLISGAKEYQKILESINERQSEADDEHLKSLDETVNKINKIKENAEKTNQDLKDTAKVLNNSTSNLGDAISNTLKKSGDIVANISNMLNLSSLANNALEQSTRSKLASQNSIMKQLGMTSESQYSQFKNSLTSTLTDMNSSMGNLFSADDMYTYFENLSEYGVTNQKVAEEQLKASVLGNKYLGVSNETQSLIFKFMKRTNNYDTLNEHNKTIVGLLKSELGVSKEQLDALSEIAYAGADSKSALGMSSKAISNQSEAMTTIGAAIESVYGSNASQSFENALNDFLLNPGNESWIQTLGSSYTSTYNKLFSSQSYDEQIDAIKSFWDALQNSSLINNGASGSGLATGLTNKTYQGLSALDDSLIAALKGGKDTELLEAETKAIAGVLATTQKDVENYVQDTTEITLLESLENSTSFIKDKVESWNSGVFNLANIALGLYIASGTVKTISNISKFLTGGKLSSLLGTGSEGLGGTLVSLLGKAGPIALGVAAVGAGIAAGWSLWNKKQEEKFNEGNEIASGYEKTLIANGTNEGTAAFQAGVSGLSEKRTGTGLGNGFMSGVVADELGIDKSIWKSPSEEFQETANKYANKFAWDSYNKLKLGRVFFSNTYDSYDNEKALLALLMTLNMNNLSSDSSITEPLKQVLGTNISFSDSDIKDIIKTRHLGTKELAEGLSILMGTDTYLATSGGKFFAYPSIDEMYEKFYTGDDELQEISGYHKAGKYYIPKDNYKALLHKGEMVLNEKEAAAIREYMGLGTYGYGGQSDETPRPKGKIIDTWPWPMTAGYPSYPSGNQHRGLDFGIPVGTKVGAAVDGQIITAYTGDNYNTYASGRKVFGQYILMKGNNGLFYRYGHLSKVGVSNNQQVKAGQTIGLSGNTGYSTGPHLHFQVQTGTANNTDIYPYNYVTSGLFQTTGSIGSTSTSSQANASGETANVESSTRRFIPGASVVQNTGGVGGVANNGASQIVSSVDGGFNKLISYLESISKRQDEQQILLETFSKSRTSGPDF